MHRLFGRVLCTIFCGAAALLAGCGPAQEAMHPVEGKILVDGKPLAKGSIVLFPDAAKNNTTQHQPRGTVVDGRYKVITHPREGAPPGWYKVGVTAVEPSDPKNPYSDQRSTIPEKYGKVEETKVAVEVRRDPPAGAYDLEFK